MIFRRKKRRPNNTPKRRPTNRATTPQSTSPTEPTFLHPRICLFDVSSDVHNSLSSRFHCTAGSLGALVEVNNDKPDHYTPCLLNHNIPSNLHEYDIVVIDLQNPRTIPYDPHHHAHTKSKATHHWFYASPYPQQLFDPRAASAELLRTHLDRFSEKESILIVFAAPGEVISYRQISRPDNNSDDHYCSLYSFYIGNPLPDMETLSGKDTHVSSVAGTRLHDRLSELRNLLERYCEAARYNVVFTHPAEWDLHSRELVERADFIPLMASGTEQVVSFVQIKEDNLIFVFPEFGDKTSFLSTFIETILPSLVPRLYPHHTRFLWKQDPQYLLPNEQDLLNSKALIEKKYSAELRGIDESIASTRQKYAFLHDLLTQTGRDLVDTVERLLRWLCFPRVINVDKTSPSFPEEDLQAETGKGLLVIEVKGIGGRSTDSDCSQISKIRYRRSEERGKFDVYGLYIVNHQMYMPPIERDNPPFNMTQIRDAKNDKRGLLTTFDLFNLYFNVQGGFVSKDDAREALYDVGLVLFPPSNAKPIPRPHEFHYGGKVAIIKLQDLEMRSGDTIIVDSDGRYEFADVVEIRVDDKTVDSVSSGEIGVRLSKSIGRNAKLWVKASVDP